MIIIPGYEAKKLHKIKDKGLCSDCGMAVELKKMEVTQKKIKRAISDLSAFKIHDNQTPVQCFSMSPSILAYIKRRRSGPGPKKCKKVNNFPPHLFSHRALFCHLVSDFLPVISDQRFKAAHQSPVCPAFHIPAEVFKRYF